MILVPAISHAFNNAPVNQAPEIPEEAAEESDTNVSSKRARKLLQKVADLLGGRGTWAMNKSGPALAPRIQKPSDDWTVAVMECEDEYVFIAETGEAEVLEPQSLKEAKSCPDWPRWEKAIEDELKLLREV